MYKYAICDSNNIKGKWDCKGAEFLYIIETESVLIQTWFLNS